MRKTIGCIGCGNMGFALMSGFASRLSKDEYHLCVYSRTPGKMQPLESMGVEIMRGVAETAENSDILIFAVKPSQMPGVLQDAQPKMAEGKAGVSIAAGFPLARLRSMLGDECFIARCMPTTTAMVGKGVFAFCVDPVVLSQDLEKEIIQIFTSLGMCVPLPESRFTDFSALVGAGPAYIFALMHGLLQAGVTLGFSREEGAKMLSQLLAGCGELAVMKGKSFIQLRDEVCSPGGLTIAGVNVLDRAGLTGLLVEAVRKAEERGREMES